MGSLSKANTRYALGETVTMTVRYGLDGHNVLLPCEGEVVRAKPHADHFKIGARRLRPFFEPEK